MHSSSNSSKEPTLEYLLLLTKKFEPGIIFNLNISGRNISSIRNVSVCTRLYHLDASNNAIRDISALRNLDYLNYADLSFNLISDLEPLKNCSKLTSLMLQANQVNSMSEINNLSSLRNLRSVYFMDISGKNENPVCNDKDYRKKVCSSLKNLKRIDGVPLKEEVPEYDKKDDKGLNLDNMELDDGTEWYGDISKL